MEKFFPPGHYDLPRIRLQSGIAIAAARCGHARNERPCSGNQAPRRPAPL